MALSLPILSALIGLAVLGIGMVYYAAKRSGENTDGEDPTEIDPGAATKSYSELLAASLLTVLYPVARAIRWVPYLGAKIWKVIAVKALYHYHRAHGGDRTGFEVTPSNKIRLTPVKWLGPESVDDDEKPGWRAKGRDKTWSPTTLGQTGPRLGKTPVIPLDSDSWKATSILESRVAEAVDLGDTRPLYRVDEADLTATLEMDNQTGASSPALADGGTVTDLRFEPRGSPIFEDIIIDLGSDDYDGQAVSWWKAKELMLERTTTDEMHNQEERGFLAGRSRKDMMRWMWRIFLIAGLVAVVGIIGKEAIFVLFGGGGGGGAGVIPLTLLPLIPFRT